MELSNEMMDYRRNIKKTCDIMNDKNREYDTYEAKSFGPYNALIASGNVPVRYENQMRVVCVRNKLQDAVNRYVARTGLLKDFVDEAVAEVATEDVSVAAASLVNEM